MGTEGDVGDAADFDEALEHLLETRNTIRLAEKSAAPKTRSYTRRIKNRRDGTEADMRTTTTTTTHRNHLDSDRKLTPEKKPLKNC